ncbi:MAG: metal-sulfur cluster assembly factor [Actinomycetia bacterium]|nr:metal-sulfur cluster assembly factor [Actinomycetes bacterium]
MEQTATTPADAREALRDVIDPELGVSIVDLGLVYGLAIENGAATVVMTTTSPMCPLGAVLTRGVEDRLMQLEGVDSVEVHLVNEPPWTADRLSDKARTILGM